MEINRDNRENHNLDNLLSPKIPHRKPLAIETGCEPKVKVVSIRSREEVVDNSSKLPYRFNI